jgi:hypothetical protein
MLCLWSAATSCRCAIAARTSRENAERDRAPCPTRPGADSPDGLRGVIRPTPSVPCRARDQGLWDFDWKPGTRLGLFGQSQPTAREKIALLGENIALF